jgi:hypothetical protein
MKSIFALIFIVSTCAQSQSCKTPIYSLNIWDYDYSMAYTIHYKINNDSLTVTTISGIVGESDKMIISRKINQKEEKILCDFLSSFPIDSLATEYKDPLVSDGDQKRIEIIFNNKKKTIDVENFYQKDIDHLLNTVNQILGKDIQIKYKK